MHQNHIISGLRLDPTALPISPITSKEVGVLFLLTRAPLQKLDLHFRPVWSRTSTLQRTAIPVLFNLLTLLLASLYTAAWLLPRSLTEMTVVAIVFVVRHSGIVYVG